MPRRFEAYRFKDGVTPLSADRFNFVFGDMDLRLVALEDLKVSWEAVTVMLVHEGLVRLDVAIQPAVVAIGDAKDAALVDQASIVAIKADCQALKDDTQVIHDAAAAASAATIASLGNRTTVLEGHDATNTAAIVNHEGRVAANEVSIASLEASVASLAAQNVSLTALVNLLLSTSV